MSRNALPAALATSAAVVAFIYILRKRAQGSVEEKGGSNIPSAGRRASTGALPLPTTHTHVPVELQPSTYFAHTAKYEHGGLFDKPNVVQIVDDIHAYVVRFLEGKMRASAPVCDQAPSSGASDRFRCACDRLICPGSVPSGSFRHVLRFATPPSSLGGVPVRSEVMIESLVLPSADPANAAIICEHNVRINGGKFDLSKGSVYIGSGTTIEPGATIKGPTVIGRNCEIRAYSYIRGDVVMGDGCVIRTELKNCALHNGVELPHPGYVGDSLLGYKAHFGCQALTANLGLSGKSVTLKLPDAT